MRWDGTLDPDHDFAGGLTSPAMTARRSRQVDHLPAGSRRELARYLRVYGGSSLETRRDDANITAWLAASLGIIAMIYAELFAGAGILSLAWWSGWIALASGLIFIDAIRRRNRHERRIAEAEGASLRAIAAALAEDGTRMGRAA